MKRAYCNLTIRPISLKAANEYIEKNHRHHSKVSGHKFSIACYEGNRLCGVAIVGQPVARLLDDGQTLEVTRLCTDGTFNACSILYGRCARIVREMGYAKCITYILQSESGASLRASGWHCETETAGGGSWNRPSRPRELFDEQISIFPQKQKYPTQKKKRFAIEFEENKHEIKEDENEHRNNHRTADA